MRADAVSSPLLADPAMLIRLSTARQALPPDGAADQQIEQKMVQQARQQVEAAFEGQGFSFYA